MTVNTPGSGPISSGIYPWFRDLFTPFRLSMSSSSYTSRSLYDLSGLVAVVTGGGTGIGGIFHLRTPNNKDN
ncbi:hypothetical protein ARMSODRAFT_951219 [Armillaria solidipes]|uniref:Uncharacterized protein n=1 Tax=Armillaria solidipes TaxID=1076256 RepID=A0A2H3C7D0_9AGAR|nr:hypothetical protein ARMSODRAFT_951219 [Armillaria solidipes]